VINIPNTNKEFSIVNSSDLKGNIYVVKGMHFDDEGYITLSNVTKACINESQDADFDQSSVIVYNGDLGSYVTQTWDKPYTIDTDFLSTKPVENTDAGFPGGGSGTDATWFGDKLVYTEPTDVTYWDSPTNAWVDTNLSLTSGAKHPIENFRNLNYVAIGDVNAVKLYSAISATPTLVRTITLPADQTIKAMKYFNQNLYIATNSDYSEESFVFVANGLSTAYQSAYKIDATDIFDLEVYQNTVVAYASNGAIYYFTGTAFSILCAFPIFYTERILSGIGQNTLKSNGDVLYVSFSDNADNNKLLNQPEGIWCYEPKVGFYCKYPFSISTTIADTINTTDVDTGTGQITVADSWITGTEVIYRANGGTAIGGLTDETKYYVIRVDATHIKLATTLANANAGTSITLTGTGGVTQELVFFPKTDYGQTFTSNRAYALSTVDIQVTNSEFGIDIIWSAELGRRTAYTATGYLGSTSYLFESRGYLVTPRIFSEEITDQFNNFVLKWKPLKYEEDKIIVKYRTSDDNRDIVDLNDGGWDITWTSSTTFTTTDTNWADAVAGDEVEVLSLAGAGLLAHISTIAENAGTYTVTIDDAFTEYVTGDYSKAIFRNFKKLLTITTSTPENDYGFKSVQIGAIGKFIQIKLEARGRQVKIEQLKIDNKYQLPVSK